MPVCIYACILFSLFQQLGHNNFELSIIYLTKMYLYQEIFCMFFFPYVSSIRTLNVMVYSHEIMTSTTFSVIQEDYLS